MMNRDPTHQMLEQLGILIDGLARGTWYCGLNPAECENLLLEAGLIVKAVATESDAEHMEDVEVGDEICRLTGFAVTCRDVARRRTGQAGT